MPGILFPQDSKTPLMIPDWILRELMSLWLCHECGQISQLFDLELVDGELVCTECGSIIPAGTYALPLDLDADAPLVAEDPSTYRDPFLERLDNPCGLTGSGPGVQGAEPLAEKQ